MGRYWFNPCREHNLVQITRFQRGDLNDMMSSKNLLFFTFLIVLCCTGCKCNSVNFVGMTKEQVAERLERGPRMKNGEFRVLYPLSASSPHTLVHHFHKSKRTLLDSGEAMKAPQWQVFFHIDGSVWHSFLLTFKKGVVVSQEDRRQPHWTMAEP